MPTLRRALRGAPLFLVALASTSLFACTTLRGRADDAYAKGDYAAAAKLYQDVVANNPNDREALENLQIARTQALSAMLVAMDTERRNGHIDAAFDKLDEVLGTRQTWSHKADAKVEARITTETSWAAAYVRGEVMKLVDAGLPLSAETRLDGRKAMARSELASTTGELNAAIDAAGLKNCGRLTGESSARAPYFTRFTSVYCTHFHASAPAAVPLPNVVSGVDLYTSVDGLDDAQRARLAAAASQWLASSLYFGPSQRHAAAVASGRQKVSFGVSTETITRPWTESVPYQAREEYQEEFQEPYTDYETVFKTCGTGTSTYSCNEQHAVTKYRTAYRTRTRTVTRYRDEPRVFTFQARKHTGVYESAFTVRFDLGEGLAPLDVSSTTTVQQSGLEHDTSFPPAGVEPSRPQLLSADGFFSARLDALAAAFPQAARDHWKKAFCGGASFTPETAARCAYAVAPSYPQGVRAALATSFGQDVDEALRLER